MKPTRPCTFKGAISHLMWETSLLQSPSSPTYRAPCPGLNPTVGFELGSTGPGHQAKQT